ncbi:MAG: amino acid racemase [archaeon]|nr:amino acid racemase [archaeon]
MIYFTNRPTKTIGVLGGMGPEATALFYQLLIEQCQKQYGAQLDEDYPEILIYNLPIPNILKGINEGDRVLNCLVGGAKRLESADVDFLVMPCNTATYFYEEIVKEIFIPFLSIVAETAKRIKSQGCKRVGLLATETTVQTGLYFTELEKNGVKLITPKNQAVVDQAILNVLAGKKLAQDKKALGRIVQEMEKRGAKGIVLGCTELPILVKQEDLNIRVFNSLEILAEATINYSMQKVIV